jgi:predicted nucleic-acid-binding protein
MPPEKVYLIDTNVVLRFLFDDHATFSPKAKLFMQNVYKKARAAVIPAVVLAECVYVLEKFYRVPRSDIFDNLSRLLTYPGIVNADKAALLKALMLYLHSGTDIVDCILAAFSSEHSLLVSFDKDFSKLKAHTENL